MLKRLKLKWDNLFKRREPAPEQGPALISYEALRAFNDEPAISLTRSEYKDIQNAIRAYVTQGGDLSSGKISRKVHGLKYSVSVAEGNFILSYSLERINVLESYIYRKKGDTTPLEVDKRKKPLLYDVGVNLSTGEALFIKEYRDTNINLLAPENDRNKQINNIKSEYVNLKALKAPCLFWQRNDNKFYIATRYVDKYDFYEWMHQNIGTYSESLEIFCMIVENILALHKSGWIHRDIKSENFIPSRVKNKLQLTAIDHATLVQISELDKIKNVVGSEYALNPSWKLDLKVGKDKYGPHTDIYALNTLFKDVLDYIHKGTKLPICNTLSHSIKNLRDKPVRACYSAEKLLSLAGEVTEALKLYESNKQSYRYQSLRLY